MLKNVFLFAFFNIGKTGLASDLRGDLFAEQLFPKWGFPIVEKKAFVLNCVSQRPPSTRNVENALKKAISQQGGPDGMGHVSHRCALAGLGVSGRKMCSISQQPSSTRPFPRTAGSPPALCMTSSEAPDALQAAERSELLNPVRANCWISARALYDFIGGSEGVTGLSMQ